MNKQLLAVVVSVVLFASPLLVSAQSLVPTNQSNTWLIAVLTQLIQTLEQELLGHRR